MAEFSTNDLYGPLLSLANQKSLRVGEKLAEKNTKLSGVSEVLPDPREELLGNGPEQAGLLDIAESSGRRSLENLFDAAHGRTRPQEEVQELADFLSGVSPEARQNLVSNPQQEVIESLAAGNYGDALIGSVKAAPGTLADSASVLPEIAAGAALTALGGSGLPVLANRGRKIFGGGKEVIEKVQKAKKGLSRAQLIKEAAKTLPKTASQMSIVTADITQQGIADFEEKHGERPSNERIAGMYALNLVTMTAEGGILKQLFIPKFKKEFVKEAKNVVKNMGKGSNLKSFGARIGSGLNKTFIAGGAEAAQEYAQTWAEIVNVEIGPNEDFLAGVKREISKGDNKLKALAGAFLGFGAGGLARGAIAAPSVAVGTTLDTAKGTVKVAADVTKGVVKTTGKVIQNVANKASLKVLSQEERNVIASEYGSRKAVVDATEKGFNSAVDKVKQATTIGGIKEGMRTSPPITQSSVDIVAEALATLEESSDRKTVERAKHKIVAAYKSDALLLKAELEASNVAAIAKKSGQNVQTASVDAAKAAVEAVDPGVKAVVAAVENLGPKTVEAVKAIRSSAARGIIDLAATAGKKEVATIVEAAKGLSLDDLKRTTNVVNQIKPEVGRKLESIIKQKEKALRRTGQKVDEIVSDETLNPVIRDVAKRAVVAAKEVAAVSSAINKVVASKIDDLVALKDTEAAVAAIEKSDSFKKQINGAMTKENLETVKRKLAAARVRLEGETETIKDKVVQGAKDAVQAATPVVKAAAKKVGEAVKGATAPTIKISSTFRAIVEQVGETIKDPKQAKFLVDAAPDFLKQMKKFGVETRSQFEAFVAEFPDLQNDVAFFKKLEEAYPSDISANEVFDNVKTKAVETIDKIKEAYNRMNPPECKV